MENKFRVLILTADAGFGHRSAAIALHEAIQMQYADLIYSEIVNPLDNKHAPNFLRDSQSDYDKWVRDVPELYRFGYQASDGIVTSSIMESILTVFLYEAIKEVVTDFLPQLIVTTYPLYQAPLNAVLSVNNLLIPIMTVLTDISTLHRIWFNTDVDYLIVPNKKVEEIALTNGILPQKIFSFGIPVHPKISLINKTKNDLRKELGWETNKITLLAVGSKRVEHFQEMLEILNHSGYKLQLIIVAGKDLELFGELQGVEWHQTTHIYNFVEEMPRYLKAADIILSKAGGLIVTEALASGLPLLLIDIIPGQETGNAEFVVDNHAGYMINSPIELLSAIYDLTNNRRQNLKNMRENANKLGNPKAAFKIAEKIVEVLQQANIQSTASKDRRLKILDLLSKNQIRVDA